MLQNNDSISSNRPEISPGENMKNKLAMLAPLLSFLLTATVYASEDAPAPQTLFKNVNIFNGTDNRLYENHQVLVEGSLIKAISAGTIETKAMPR